jgi:enediyne biosynthesis protein E4
MSRSFPFVKVLLLAAVIVAAGAGLWCYLANREEKPDPDTPNTGAVDGFREGAREAGITFRMDYLSAEQGEKFKINLYDHGCGVAVGDYNADGHEDVYFVNQLGRNALYRNKGDGTFEDVTEKAGVGLGDRVCVGATFADYMNDGYPGLYVTSTRGGNVLFRNNHDGTFTNVTKKAGLICVAHSQTATFFDFDNDGYLDLLVTNTAKWTVDEYNNAAHYFPGLDGLFKLAVCPPEYNILYRNNRDGTFTDVTEKAGLKGKGWSGDVAVFDYDGDGYLDVFITNMFGASQLYRNNGKGGFVEVTKDVLGRTSFGAIGCKVFDFNNDGRLDLLIADMHSDMWLPPHFAPLSRPANELKRKYPYITGPGIELGKATLEEEKGLGDALKIPYKDVLFGNTFFKALSTTKFEEVSDKANLETFWPWGIGTGDFDNDGYEDVFLPSGMGFPWDYWPNALLMNNGDETFTDRADSAGIEPPPFGMYFKHKFGDKKIARSSRAVAVADFSGNGRLDLMVNNFNDHPYYFRNHFPKKNYVAFRLTGTKSNRDAIGALVKIHIGKEVMLRQVQGAGGYLSQSSRTAHFGLGERAKIDRVEIRWPSGQQQQIEAPAINTLHKITEPKGKE